MINNISSRSRILVMLVAIWTSIALPHRDSAEYKLHYDRIYNSHHFAKTRNQDAVPAAIRYIMEQEERGYTNVISPATRQHPNYHTYKAGGNIPPCNVTYDALVEDTTFEYLGNDFPAPYSYDTCFSMPPTYQVAPVCSQREKDSGYTEAYKWKWVLNAAKEGKCTLPEYTPLSAGIEYLQRKEANGEAHRVPTKTSTYPLDEPGEAVNILWLGLSFMGQPFLSLGCRYRDMLSKTSRGHVGSDPEKPLFDVLDSTGHCTHTCPDCCNPSLHPPGETCKVPTQWCQPSLFVFETPPGIQPHKIVRICYQYTFNLPRNMARLYSRLPCDFKWSDVDVVFGLHSAEEFKLYFSGTHAPMSTLTHVKTVLVDFSSFEGKLNHSYVANGFPAFDKGVGTGLVRGKPKDCVKNDIHLRMPGLPDYYMQVQFYESHSALQNIKILIYPLCKIDDYHILYDVMIWCDLRALAYCGWCGPNIKCWSMMRGKTTYSFDERTDDHTSH